MSTNHSPNTHAVLHSETSDGAHDAVTHRHHHKAGAPKPSVNLNVTSMVDILFNLLVYFIVTVNFTADETSLKAKLPGPPGGTSKDDDTPADKHPIVVDSTKDGYGCTVLFKSKRINDFNELSAVLKANNHEKNRAGTLDPNSDMIVIQPTGKVRWQHVVNAFNQATGAGYRKISFSDAN